MFSRWLLSLALLSGTLTGSALPRRGRLTLAPAGGVKVHPGAEFILNCGDGQQAGVVQYWHTPLGDLHSPGIHGNPDSVVMRPDGSLVISSSRPHHSGLYYCLLQGTEGATLWPYQLQVTPGQHTQINQRDSRHLSLLLKHGAQNKRPARQGGRFLDLRDPGRQATQQDSSYSEARLRRDLSALGPEHQRQAGVSDGQFAAAVAASVVLTFLLGFSAGALSRAHVLRCLGAAAKWVQSLRQQGHQTDTAGHGCEVTMTTLPPMYDSEAFQVEQEADDVTEDNSALSVTMETTASTTTSPSPPAKPQRSFRQKREEELETAAHLEGRDVMGADERGEEGEKEAGRTQEERGSDGEGGSPSGGGGGGSKSPQTVAETDEERSEERDRDGRRDSNEEEEARRPDEEEDEGKEGRGSSVSASEDNSSDSLHSSEDTDEEEKGREKQEEKKNSSGEGGEEPEEAACSAPPRPQPARRSRVIRLYQYDEEGQRYSHLASPAPDEPVPAPRLKQRSLSLTRLNAIMAAASAGPMDSPTGEAGGEERKESPLFHVEI